ncbi:MULTISPECIES: c-type cytochrome [Dyella]|uniref:Cytochrome c n=2 Tax=Dyella TaxID=231454 RepID=A0A4R0YTY6_9GAMM|nr:MULTISPECIES: cytochrome c [Dyella]TBR39552.1 cytochrome c [Dyella terrae]TCI12865.1 cytochrome c [Dyella soli]
MNRALTLISFGAILAFASTQSMASGNIEAGKNKAATCFACHGTDGNAVDPQYPRLAGQYNVYLQQVLHEYKDGHRNNAIMKGFVATLSEQDIEDVAAYFSSLPTKLDTLNGHIQGDK